MFKWLKVFSHTVCKNNNRGSATTASDNIRLNSGRRAGARAGGRRQEGRVRICVHMRACARICVRAGGGFVPGV